MAKHFFTSILRRSSTILLGQLSLINVVARVYDLGQFITVISFIFNLICFVDHRRAYLIQAGCSGAMSVREAVQ
jgi:hypothetical protein